MGKRKHLPIEHSRKSEISADSFKILRNFRLFQPKAAEYSVRCLNFQIDTLLIQQKIQACRRYLTEKENSHHDTDQSAFLHGLSFRSLTSALMAIT